MDAPMLSGGVHLRKPWKPWSKTSVIYRFLWMSKYLHMIYIYIHIILYIYIYISYHIFIYIYISYHMYLFIYISLHLRLWKILSKQHIHIRSEPQHNCDGGSRWGGTGGSCHPGDPQSSTDMMLMMVVIGINNSPIYNHGIMVVNMVLCWYDVYDDGGHWPQPSQLVIAP